MIFSVIMAAATVTGPVNVIPVLDNLSIEKLLLLEKSNITPTFNKIEASDVAGLLTDSCSVLKATPNIEAQFNSLLPVYQKMVKTATGRTLKSINQGAIQGVTVISLQYARTLNSQPLIETVNFCDEGGVLKFAGFFFNVGNITPPTPAAK